MRFGPVAALPFAVIAVLGISMQYTPATADTVGSPPIAVGQYVRQFAVTPDGATLYAVSGSGTVAVIDIATSTVTATITGFNSPVGIAIDQAGTFAYITNDSGHSVSVIPIPGTTISTTFPLGPTDNPVDIEISADGTTAYVTNFSGDVSVLDTGAGVTGFIDTLGLLRNAKLTPDGASLLVAEFSNGSLTIADTTTGLVTARVTGLNFPWGIAINGNTAYVANNNGGTVSVIDIPTATKLLDIPGFTNPTEVVLNPAGTLAYVADNGGTTISVVDLVTNTLLTTIAGFDHPWGLAMDPQGAHVFTGDENGTSAYIVTLSPAVPGAPVAVAGDGQATISATAAAAGSGGPPTSYTITAAPGGAVCTIVLPATSCAITGLTNGTAYSFTAVAINGGGSSGTSPASATVIPAATPPALPATGLPGIWALVALLSLLAAVGGLLAAARARRLSPSAREGSSGATPRDGTRRR